MLRQRTSAGHPKRTPARPASTPAKRVPQRRSLASRDFEERGPCGLLRAPDRLEAGLPAAERGLVLDEEPEHDVDARVLPRDRVGLRQPRRLLRVADPEGLVVGFHRLPYSVIP